MNIFDKVENGFGGQQIQTIQLFAVEKIKGELIELFNKVNEVVDTMSGVECYNTLTNLLFGDTDKELENLPRYIKTGPSV